MQEMWAQALGWEDSLEKEIVAHSNILAQEIPWTEEAWWLQSTGLQRVRHELTTKLGLGIYILKLNVFMFSIL